MKIGITERGDAGLDLSWLDKLDSVDGCIAITKAPSKLLDVSLPENVIVHCTITGLGGYEIEPNVNGCDIELKAYENLINKYGPERVVLRIDPIFIDYKEFAFEIASEALGRVRISFGDLYPHVIERCKYIPFEEQNTFHAPLEDRRRVLKQIIHVLKTRTPPSSSQTWTWTDSDEDQTEVEICAEPGMRCTGCISQRDLLAMKLIDTKSIPVLQVNNTQRKECCCLAKKVELLTNQKQCEHGCLYCYWK